MYEGGLTISGNSKLATDGRTVEWTDGRKDRWTKLDLEGSTSPKNFEY